MIRNSGINPNIKVCSTGLFLSNPEIMKTRIIDTTATGHESYRVPMAKEINSEE
jgi:hypothetical protein